MMNIKSLRIKYGLTQKEMAKILEVSQGKIVFLEKGEAELRVRDLGKLIRALDLNAEYYKKLIDDITDSPVAKRNYKK